MQTKETLMGASILGLAMAWLGKGSRSPSPAAPVAPAAGGYSLKLVSFTPTAPQILPMPAGESYVSSDLLAQAGIYASTPLTLAQATAVGYGEAIPQAGTTRITGGELAVFDPIYQDGRLVAGWHPPGTTWDWASYGWV
jgi:hypothetical protein